MNTTLGELLNINQTLKLIIDNEKNVEALFKFKLLGMVKSLESYVSNFEIIRNEKIVEYGKENDDGSFCIPEDDEDAREKFNNDMRPVLNSKIEIDIDKLKAKDVFDKGVSANYLIGLYSIIEE